MVLVRPAAFRAPLARFARPATRASPWQQSFQRTARRGYASASDVAGDVAKKASSDLPWLAVGVVITVPSVYYILSSIETGGHHAEGHGEEHHAEGEKEDESESKDEPEVKEAEGKSEGSEDKAETKDSEEKEEPKDSGDEKPADDKKEDKPDAQKEPVKGGTSGKQEGISNADTHHSTDTHDGSKSTKGEGVAETAKLKGTVQADRPGAESEQKGKANQDKSK